MGHKHHGGHGHDKPYHDELTATVLSVVESLPQHRKAALLLEHSLALIQSGRYGHEVEGYLDVYMRTPGLPEDDVAKALLARGKARKDAAQLLLMRAELDFQSAVHVDPTNREAQAQLRRRRLLPPADAPASQRAPPEVWDRIASFIPRYFLRAWLSVSSFHRDIASRHIFSTVDLFVGEDPENLHRTMDFLDRIKADSAFARRVRCLRLHWAYESGEMLDLVSRIFMTALPEFTALREFEWIGYPELQAEMVTALIASHPSLAAVGLIGWHFDAIGISQFGSLRRFTLRAEDDDGLADMGEIRAVLDANARTLTHLTLGAHLGRPHSWDSAFGSPTIGALTRLELVDTRISHGVLARIAHAHRLVELTLHGTLAAPGPATVVFGSDHVLEGVHTFLPRLQSFRFIVAGHDDDAALYGAVVQFLRRRERLRRLDLGNCPWDLVLGLLPELAGLRVFRTRIALLSEAEVVALANALPRETVALHISCVVSSSPMETFAIDLACFPALAMLHFRAAAQRRPQAAAMSDREFATQTAQWIGAVREVARALPAADYVGWHGEHFVVSRTNKDESEVEIKELPVRRRLDCGKGVDLGSEDANWLERKDVPIDYEVSGLDA